MRISQQIRGAPQAVPEPGTALSCALGAGLLGLAIMRRKARARA